VAAFWGFLFLVEKLWPRRGNLVSAGNAPKARKSTEKFITRERLRTGRSNGAHRARSEISRLGALRNRVVRKGPFLVRPVAPRARAPSSWRMCQGDAPRHALQPRAVGRGEMFLLAGVMRVRARGGWPKTHQMGTKLPYPFSGTPGENRIG